MDIFDDILKAAGLAKDDDVSPLLERMRGGVFSQESGGNYQVKPNKRTGATGGFQVLPENIPTWTQKHLGKRLTREQFERDPDAQEKVFAGEMGEYLRDAKKKAPDDDTAIRMAAAGWYGGKGAMHRYDDPKRFRPNEPSFREYTTSVLKKSQPDLISDILSQSEKLLPLGGNDYNEGVRRPQDIDQQENLFDDILSASGLTSNPVPETPQTLEAQTASALDAKSPKGGVLFTNGQEKLVDPSILSPLKRVERPEGVLYVNPNKFPDFDKRTTAELIGKVDNVKDTSKGDVLVTTDAQGNELSSSIVTPESAAKQAELDKASYPQAANQGITDVDEAVKLRNDQIRVLGHPPIDALGGPHSPVDPRYADFLKQTGLPDSPASQKEFAIAQQASDAGARAANQPVSRPARQTPVRGAGIAQKQPSKPEEITANVNWAKGSGRTAKEFALDEAASQFSSKLGIDYDTVRNYLDRKGPEGLTPEEAEKRRSSRQETSLALDANAIQEVKFLSEQNRSRKEAIERKEKEYKAQGIAPFEALLRASKDVGLTEFDGKDIDKAIADENAAEQAVMGGIPTTAKSASGLQNVTQARFGAEVPVGGSVPDDPQYKQAQLDEARKGIIASYGSFSNFQKTQERLKKEYQYRPLAEPLEFAKSFGSTVPKAVASVLKTIDIAANLNPIKLGADAALGRGIKVDETVLSQIGDGINKYIEDSKNKDVSTWYTTTLPDTIGQVLVQIGVGALSGGATAPTLLGASMGAASQYDEAKTKGATDGQKLVAATVGALAAVPDAILFNKWFKGAGAGEKTTFINNLTKSLYARFGVEFGDDAAKEMTKSALHQWAKNVGSGAIGEGLQEVSENKINDALAYATYDASPERLKKLTTINDEDIASFFGGVIGGGFGGAIESYQELKPALKTELIERTEEKLDKALRQKEISPEQFAQAQKQIATLKNEKTPLPEKPSPAPLTPEQLANKSIKPWQDDFQGPGGLKPGDLYQAQVGSGVWPLRVWTVDEAGKATNAYIDTGNPGDKRHWVVKDGQRQWGSDAPYRFVSDIPEAPTLSDPQKQIATLKNEKTPLPEKPSPVVKTPLETDKNVASKDAKVLEGPKTEAPSKSYPEGPIPRATRVRSGEVVKTETKPNETKVAVDAFKRRIGEVEKRAEAKIAEAYRDEKTGLANQNAFVQATKNLTERQKSGEDKDTHVVVLDIIGQKDANSGLGFTGSDNAVLIPYGKTVKEVAMAAGVPERDIFRAGGDEFAIHVQGEENARALAAKIQQTIGTTEHIATEKEFVNRDKSKGKAGDKFTTGVRIGVGRTFEEADAETQVAKIAEEKAKAEKKSPAPPERSLEAFKDVDENKDSTDYMYTSNQLAKLGHLIDATTDPQETARLKARLAQVQANHKIATKAYAEGLNKTKKEEKKILDRWEKEARSGTDEQLKTTLAAVKKITDITHTDMGANAKQRIIEAEIERRKQNARTEEKAEAQAPLSKDLTERLVSGSPEPDYDKFAKSTIRDFAFLINRNETISPQELADRVAKAHSLDNPKTKLAYSVLKHSDPNMHIKGKLEGRYVRGRHKGNDLIAEVTEGKKPASQSPSSFPDFVSQKMKGDWYVSNVPVKGQEAKGAKRINRSDFKKLQEEFDENTLSMVAPETPEFKKWFGDSKVVDENGKPLRLKHGSNEDIEAFENGKAVKTGNPTGEFGTFAVLSGAEASRYATDWRKDRGVVYPVFMSIQDPYRMSYKEFNDLSMGFDKDGQPWTLANNNVRDDAVSRQKVRDRKAELIKEGYDGLVVRIGGHTEWVAFYPTQIKSAIGNRGTFDPNDPNILSKVSDLQAMKDLEDTPDTELVKNLDLEVKGRDIDVHTLEGMELIRRTLGVGHSFGFTVTGKDINKLKKVPELQKFITKASQGERPVITLSLTPRAIDEAIASMAKDEERGHRIFLEKSAEGSVRKMHSDEFRARVLSNPLFKNSPIARDYKGHSKAVQVFEFTTKLMTDQFEYLGIDPEQNKEQILDIVFDTFDDYEKVNGEVDFEEFRNINETTRYFFDASKARSGKETETVQDSKKPAPEKQETGSDVEGNQKVASFSRILGQDYYYDPQSHKETEAKAQQLLSDKGTQQAVWEALNGKPSAETMRVVYWELERLNGLADHYLETGDKAFNAVAEEIADLSAKIVARQVKTGQEVEIAKTLAPLSPEVAVLTAVKMKRFATGDPDAVLTDAETKQTLEIAKELKDANKKLAEINLKLRQAENKIKRLESDREPTRRTPQARMLKEYQAKKPDLIAKLKEAFPNSPMFNGAVAGNETLRMAAPKELDPEQKDLLTQYAAGLILEGKTYDETIKTLEDIAGTDVRGIHAKAVEMIRPSKPMSDEAKERAKIRNEHYAQAKKFLKPEMSGIAQDAQEQGLSKELIFAIDRLTGEKPKSINEVVKDIEHELKIDVHKAVDIAREANQKVRDIKAKRREEADKEKGVSAEERQKLNDAKVAKARATYKLNKFLNQLSHRPWVMERFNNDFRAKLVSNWGTQLFNAVQGTLATGTESILDLMETGLKIVGNPNPETTLDINAKDTWLPLAYVFSSNKQIGEQALSEFPEEYYKVHSGLLGDIELDTPKLAPDAHALTKPFHAWFDKMDVLNKHLSNISGAKMQEMHFRNAIVASSFDQVVRKKSGGKETLKTALANNTLTQYITEQEAKLAADKALRVTFASMIDDPVGKQLKRVYDQLDKVLPVILNPVTFARFTYTTTKVMVANPLLMGALDSKTLGGEGYNTRSIAKGILGWSAIVLSYGLLSAFGDDDDRWETLKIGDNTFDVRRFFPMSAFFYMAHLIKSQVEGRPTPDAKELVEGFASLETDYFRYGAPVEMASVGIEKYKGTKDWSDVGAATAGMIGSYLAGFTRFFKPMKDALAQFDEDEAKFRDFSDSGKDKFIKEISKSLPFVARGIAPTIDPVTGKEIEAKAPLAKSIGINIVNPSFLNAKETPATEWANRLFQFTPQGEWTDDARKAFFIRKRLKEAVYRKEVRPEELDGRINEFVKQGKLTEKSAAILRKDLQLSELQVKLKYGYKPGKNVETQKIMNKKLEKVLKYATDQEKADIERVIGTRMTATAP